MKNDSKINFTKMANLVFTLTGTVIIIVFLVISVPNFFRDSRFFGQALAANDPIPTATPIATPVETGISIEDKSLVLDNTNRIPRQTEPASIDETAKPTKKPNIVSTPSKISVRLINYTGIPNNGETVRKLLEQNGYMVASEAGVSSGRVSTKVLNKNTLQHGFKIRDIIKFGKVSDDYDSNSKYDVVVILGDDYEA